MRWLNRLAVILLGAFSAGFLKSFLEKYEVIVLDKEEIEVERSKGGPIDINDLKPENYDKAMDLRGTPTHECVCGCNIWNVKVIFDNFQIATYFLDMECANCGSLATAPTPVDDIEGTN